MAGLTILDDIRVATPCDKGWDEMAGDDRVRFCSECSRSVYNIVAMTSDEVAATIAGREGRLCLRIYRRADGTVLTADCPGATTAPAAPRYRFRRVHALALVLAAVAVSWAYSSKRGEPRPSGTDVSWDDWVHWAAVSLGVRPEPVPPPIFTPPPEVITGDMY